MSENNLNESPSSPLHRKILSTNTPKLKLTAITSGIPFDEIPLDYLNTTSFTDIYLVDRVLGAGNFGVVIKVIEKNSGNEYAIKVIPKDSMHEEQINAAINEVSMLRKAAHPHIVKFIKVYFEGGIKNRYMNLVIYFLLLWKL